MGGGDVFGMDVPSVDDVLNFGVNMSTMGVFGWNNGGFQNGIVSDAVRNVGQQVGRGLERAGQQVGAGIKDVTGVAAQEEALRQQQIALKEAKTQADLDRQGQIERRRQQELAASRAAQVGSRTPSFYTPPGSTTSTFGSSTEPLGV